VERTLGRLRSELGYITIDEIMHIGLHEFLNDLQEKMNEIGDNIFDNFFAIKPIEKTSMTSNQSAIAASL